MAFIKYNKSFKYLIKNHNFLLIKKLNVKTLNICSLSYLYYFCYGTYCIYIYSFINKWKFIQFIFIKRFPDKRIFRVLEKHDIRTKTFPVKTYYKFYINFKQKILDIQNSNKNKKINIEAKFLNSDHLSLSKQYENVPFVLVSLIPKNKTDIKKKLLIASHFDGHNLIDGGTAYDDAIHTVTMLGVIDAISRKDIELNTQVDFLFDGAEEFGLVGAYQYVAYLKENNITEKYDYLNLEAMGGTPPYAFVIKNNYGNYRVQKTLS